MQCPTPNSFQYNSTLCFCNPGYLYNDSSNSCTLFTVHPDDWVVGSGVDNSINFPETIFSFDSIKKYTQSQAVFLEATLVMIVIWLLFCFGARFGSLGDGRTRWFKIRWWISRLDICFATRHWLDDQKVMKKRKTELGGTFSIASWILFIGLLAALLYQIISKRTVEMHSVRATNAPELALFMNDMEFNITTISSMSCSNLRGLGTLVTGSPGFIDSRVTPLSAFVSYSCHNTTKGPTITLKCNNCQLIRDNAFISWQFIDLPNYPATAVGFEFNLTAKSHASNKHLSFVSGKLKNGSTSEEKSITYRGRNPNVLKFNLFPRIYHNHHDLRLIQPLFHDFLPGSSFSDRNQLQSSLQSSNDGLINTTLYINFLSAYVVEIDNQDIFGPVSFLADLGGLYCISIGVFFYFLVQCEYRVKKFRNEDNIMRRVRSRRKAQEHWNKLRKYVRFTWGCTAIPPEYESAQGDACCSGFMVEKHGSSRKRKQQHKLDTISLNRKVNLPGEKKSIPEENHIQLQGVKSCLVKSASNLEGRSSCASGRHENSSDLQLLKNVKTESASGLLKKDVSPDHVYAAADDQIPLPPSIDIARGSEISVSDIQRNIENLYEYNVMLRERLVVAQSVLNALTTKGTTFSSAEKKLVMTQLITEIP